MLQAVSSAIGMAISGLVRVTSQHSYTLNLCFRLLYAASWTCGACRLDPQHSTSAQWYEASHTVIRLLEQNQVESPAYYVSCVRAKSNSVLLWIVDQGQHLLWKVSREACLLAARKIACCWLVSVVFIPCISVICKACAIVNVYVGHIGFVQTVCSL